MAKQKGCMTAFWSSALRLLCCVPAQETAAGGTARATSVRRFRPTTARRRPTASWPFAQPKTHNAGASFGSDGAFGSPYLNEAFDGDAAMARSGSGDNVEEPLLQPASESGYSSDDDAGRRGGHHVGANATRCTTWQTTSALLTLQLGWGLWLLPCDFARLGWAGGFSESVWSSAQGVTGCVRAVWDGVGLCRRSCGLHCRSACHWLLAHFAATVSTARCSGGVPALVLSGGVRACWRRNPLFAHPHPSNRRQPTPSLLSSRQPTCPAGVLAVLAGLTTYSGSLFNRLYHAVPDAGARAAVRGRAAFGVSVAAAVLRDSGPTTAHVAYGMKRRHIRAGTW